MDQNGEMALIPIKSDMTFILDVRLVQHQFPVFHCELCPLMSFSDIFNEVHFTFNKIIHSFCSPVKVLAST